MNDLKSALRQLLKNPGFTLVAVLTLGFGIGANTAMFSIIEAVLVRPLPFENAGQLVRFWERNSWGSGMQQGPISMPDFRDFQSQNTVFQKVAAFHSVSFNLTGHDEPVRLHGEAVSTTLFSILGVHPVIGRAFLPEEETAGRNHVVLLSQKLWQTKFGSDSKILNQPLKLNGQIFTVTGVMPANFKFPGETDFWVPVDLSDETMKNRGAHFLSAVGRLKTGVSPTQAQNELNLIAKRLEVEHPGTNTRWNSCTVLPLREQLTGEIRTPLALVSGAVAFVLLIACANIANLLLAKAAGRRKELAVRAALGASRSRIVRQLLCESVFLSLLGGLLGLALAAVTLGSFRLFISAQLENLAPVALDLSVLGFTLIASLIVGVFFGLFPALNASRIDLNSTLKQGGRSAMPTGNRARNLLVIAQVALSVTLLIGAGLLLKSFVQLRNVDPGFRAENVLTMRFSLPEQRYPNSFQQSAFIAAAVERIERLPGVEAAGTSSTYPLSHGLNSYGFRIEGREPTPGENFSAEHDPVTPNYFRALGIPLLKGRPFSERDHAQAPRVVLINETAARRFFPNDNPIGKRVIIASPEAAEIIGVVKDVKQYSLDHEAPAHMYSPQMQKPDSTATLFIRSKTDPTILTHDVRALLRQLDGDLPVSNIRTMDAIIDESVLNRRVMMTLLGIFSGVALLLSVIGLYGVLSYLVAQRTQEIGLRMALGADRMQVLNLVTKQGVFLTLCGLAIGLCTSLALTRALTQLYGVGALDPGVFCAVSVILMIVSSVAALIPALRASRISPLEALRCE